MTSLIVGYTVVQHSGYGYGSDPQFRKGLESRAVTASQKRTVERAGGVVFPTYAAAEDYADAQMYPPTSGGGLIPNAPGEFALFIIDGLAIYRPPTTAYNVLVPVVEVVHAATPEAAERALRDRLSKAGFEPHEEGADVFESEPV